MPNGAMVRVLSDAITQFRCFVWFCFVLKTFLFPQNNSFLFFNNRCHVNILEMRIVVTAFFQFGFRLRTGIVTKTYHDAHTSDWVGPYNMILAPIEKTGLDEDSGSNPLEDDQKNLFVSRYVNTPFTETALQRPFADSGIFNFDPEILEDVVGLKAINETIHEQIQWRGTPKAERQDSLLRGQAKDDDPYSKYARTCAHGDLRPILPRLEVVKITHPAKGENPPKHNFHMKVHYPILSVPENAADPLYKLWPTMKSHLSPQFPLKGPCT